MCESNIIFPFVRLTYVHLSVTLSAPKPLYEIEQNLLHNCLHGTDAGRCPSIRPSVELLATYSTSAGICDGAPSTSFFGGFLFTFRNSNHLLKRVYSIRKREQILSLQSWLLFRGGQKCDRFTFPQSASLLFNMRNFDSNSGYSLIHSTVWVSCVFWSVNED